MHLSLVLIPSDEREPGGISVTSMHLHRSTHMRLQPTLLRAFAAPVCVSVAVRASSCRPSLGFRSIDFEPPLLAIERRCITTDLHDRLFWQCTELSRYLAQWRMLYLL